MIPFFSRRRRDRELDEEIRSHLRIAVEERVARGASLEDAERAVRREFGAEIRVKEVTRTMWGGMWVDTLARDLGQALRGLGRSPGFAAVVVLTLALGVGASTAIFSVVDGILFRPLPFPESERLVAVWADRTRIGGPDDEWTNFPDFFDLQERSRNLQTVAAWGAGTRTLTGRGDPEELPVAFVTHGMISGVLRVDPALGRGFVPEDDRAGAPGSVIVSDGLWRRALAADPGVLGTTLTLNDEPYEVIGVMPPDFDSPFAPDAELWLPMRQDRTVNGCPRGNACLRVLARLAPGVTMDEARVEANDIARQLEEEYPGTNTGIGTTLLGYRDDLVAGERAGLLVLLAAVAVVLLIACVNIANLMLARATTRAPEMAVRAALGAGRPRLIAQLLTESALLVVIGGGIGLIFAYAATDLLVSIAPAGTPRVDGVGVDGRVLGFALTVTLLSGLLFGLAPSLRSSRAALESALREGGREGVGGGMRARSVLVSAQVALALVLMVGAGLLVRSFQNLRAEDLGFRPEGVVSAQIGLPSTRYPDAAARRAFVAAAEERLAGLPGVQAVGTTSWLPLTGFGTDTDFTIEGRPLPADARTQAVWFRRITPGYPEAMGMTLVAGRWFTDADDDGAPWVVVIDDAMARRVFPDGSPLGQRINLGSPANPTWREIVGVAKEARYFGIRGDGRNALYVPYRQVPSSGFIFTLRSEGSPAALASDIRATIADIDPSMAVSLIRPMEQIVADALGPQRFVTMLLGLFAAVAVALAVIGLYGVVSYGVNRRIREMGVRVALGAEDADIGRLVLAQSMKLVGVGLLFGVAGGLASSRLLANLLFGVSAADPWTYGLVAVVLTTVTAAASAVPARRATRVDPIRVLRSQ